MAAVLPFCSPYYETVMTDLSMYQDLNYIHKMSLLFLLTNENLLLRQMPIINQILSFMLSDSFISVW